MYRTLPNFSDIDFRDTVVRVFKQWKQQTGGVARINIACCGGCASAELASNPRNHNKPALFLHAQDQPRFAEGQIFVKHGIITNSEREDAGDVIPDTEKREEAAAELFCELVERAGLVWQWDGRMSQTIEVFPNTEVYAAVRREEVEQRIRNKVMDLELRAEKRAAQEATV